ncbi:hypothetical protein K2173_010021 [Erythroxylum novogranatense]|uniref:Tyrosine decarboxylase n=1 Tax=Erythroxylum novogranatense TaxID=1862640 RepID=A0AAV8S548_9ROSI|nr:hypothetical protein K2173_010021 [Erythroxylum novogranatense]
MDAEQLRECGHKMVDFIADYYKTIETIPVLSQVEVAHLLNFIFFSFFFTLVVAECAILCFTDVSLSHFLVFCLIADVKAKILPGVTHWQSPNYFAYYPSNSSIAGFLGEMLSAGVNIVGFSWITSPAATELEMIVLDWLGKMLKLPEDFLSSGNHLDVRLGSNSCDKVLQRIWYYVLGQGGGVIQGTASEAVLVVLLAARDKVLGRVGKNSLEKLVVYASDQTHSALQKACQKNGIWFHVDAAYAGSACICPEYRHYLDGVEEADSFNMNAHKWLLTNFDCSALWVKVRVFPVSISLKLWMVLRLYGLENLQCYIRNHINLAKYFEGLVAGDSRFEVVSPRIFSLVCFRLLPPDDNEDVGNKLNHDLLDAVNSSGRAFISHTVLSGKYILRFAIGAPLTEERHVAAAWKILQDEASALIGVP